MNCALKLKKARGKIPASEVCEKCGISPSALRMYEAGLRIPRDEIKKKLANFYKTTVQELFFED